MEEEINNNNTDDDTKCISKNGSNCFCNKEDFNDPDNYQFLEQHLLENVPIEYCNHSYYGIKASRRNITLKGKCFHYSHKTSPSCYECKKPFLHLEWYTYFWGCNQCFENIFLVDVKYRYGILYCENCSEKRLLFNNNENRRTGSFTIKNKIPTKSSNRN